MQSQGNPALSSLQKVRSREDLIACAKAVPRNTLIVVFTRETCPPCNEYKPILESFLCKNPNFRKHFVLCVIDEDMMRNSTYVSVPKLFKGISSIPTTIGVRLEADRTFSMVGQPRVGVLTQIEAYALSILSFVDNK